MIGQCRVLKFKLLPEQDYEVDVVTEPVHSFRPLSANPVDLSLEVSAGRKCRVTLLQQLSHVGLSKVSHYLLVVGYKNMERKLKCK